MENKNFPDDLDENQGEKININNSQIHSAESLANDEEIDRKNSRKSWILLAVVILAVVAVAIFVVKGGFFGRKSNEVLPVLPSNNAVNEEEEDNKEKVHYIGILPLHNPSMMLDRFGALENYLNENTNLNVKMRFYPTEGDLGGYTAVVKDVAEGRVSFAFLASVTTVQANGNGPVIPIVCAEKDGSPTYRGDLVVKTSAPFQKIEDLQGKKVSGTSVSSTSGGLMPNAYIQSLGINSDEYFDGGLQYLGSHDKALEAILRGVIDAAFVNEQTLFKFQKEGSQLRSIWRHDPVPEFPFVVNTEKVSQSEIDEFVGALLKAHEVDQKTLTRIDADYERFVKIGWEDYLPIKEAVDKVHGEIFYDLEKWGKE